MAESIYSWIQDLACFFILATAVMQFLPDNSYKKYVEFYMGLLLILVILSPAFRVTGLEEEIQSFVKEFQDTWTGAEDWKEKARDWEESWTRDQEGEDAGQQEGKP